MKLTAAILAAGFAFLLGLALRKPCPEPVYEEPEDGVQPVDAWVRQLLDEGKSFTYTIHRETAT